MEQEQEVKNVAPEPEVTQSNEEDSDDDVIAPSGSVGSGKQERQRSFCFPYIFLCCPLRQAVLSVNYRCTSGLLVLVGVCGIRLIARIAFLNATVSCCFFKLVKRPLCCFHPSYMSQFSRGYLCYN